MWSLLLLSWRKKIYCLGSLGLSSVGSFFLQPKKSFKNKVRGDIFQLFVRWGDRYRWSAPATATHYFLVLYSHTTLQLATFKDLRHRHWSLKISLNGLLFSNKKKHPESGCLYKGGGDIFPLQDWGGVSFATYKFSYRLFLPMLVALVGI